MPVLGIYLARQEIHKGTSEILLLSLTDRIYELSSFLPHTSLPSRLWYAVQIVELAQVLISL